MNIWKGKTVRVNITLIRHGQVPGNLEKRFVGVTNEPLTEEGRKVIESNTYPEADLLYVSPLIRCKETAKIIYPEMEQIVVENLREMNFGSFENKKFAELEGDPEFEEWNATGGKVAAKGGETIDEFLGRVMDGFDELVNDAIGYCEENDINSVDVSVVAHGGTIMGIQSELGLCGFYDKMYENGGSRLIVLEVDDKEYRVV